MSRRALLVLAVTAALLGGYVLLFERDPGGDGVRRRVLPKLQRQQVTRIRIVCSAPRRVLELARGREGEAWRLTAPFRGRADQGSLSRLLALLEFLEPHRAVPEGTNRRQLGLAPPRAVITLFAGKKGARAGLGGEARSDPRAAQPVAVGAQYEAIARLEVGQLDPSGHGVYLGHRGALYVVDRELHDIATGSSDAWRDRRLAPAWTVKRIRITGRDRSTLDVELAHTARLRLDEGGWIRVDPTAGRRLVAAVAGLRASRFVRREGDVDAGVTVLVEGKGGRLVLQLGGPCPGRPAERQVVARERGEPPVACCVEKEDLAPFVAASEDSLVDRRLVHVGAPDLERIRIHTKISGARIELVRDAGRWRYDSGEGADGVVVREWVDALAHLEGRVQRGSGSAFAERGRIELGGGPGQPKRVLRLGAASDGELPMRRGDEPAVVWIPEGQALKVLRVQRLHFRSRRVVELSHHLVSRLVTSRGREREVLVRGDDGWALVEPARAPVDQAHVAELLRTISRLRAIRLLEKQPKGARRSVTLELTVRREKLLPGDAGPPAAEVTRLRLSLPAGDGPCYAGSASPTVWFELEPVVCRLLARRRADRRLLRSTKAMTRIELSLDRQRIVVEKRGPAWHDAGSGKTLETTAVAELIQTLRGLQGRTRYDLQLVAPTLEVRVQTTDGGREGFVVDAHDRSRRLSGKVCFEVEREQAAKLRGQVRAIQGR